MLSFARRRIIYRVESWLLTFLLYGLITGCSPTQREVVGPLETGHEIVTLNTRPGVTMRILLAKPNAASKGTFIFFPGGHIYQVKAELTAGHCDA